MMPTRLIMLVTLIIVANAAVFGGLPSSTDESDYAWGENIGRVDVVSHAAAHDTYLTGHLWCENIGWVALGQGPQDGTQYVNQTAANHGVNRHADGSLSGYAWAENVGWINFDTRAVLEEDGAALNPDSGLFSGYAWGENTGWINLNGAALPCPECGASGGSTSDPAAGCGAGAAASAPMSLVLIAGLGVLSRAFRRK